MANNNSIWDNHKELILGAIVFPLIGFLITLFISNIAQSQFVWQAVFCLLGIITLVISSSLFIVYLMHKKEQDIKNKGCWHAIELLSSYKANLTHDSLISYEELERIEEEVSKNEKIIIFTSQFNLDSDPEFQKKILKNFEENVEYVYIIPNETAKIDKIKNIVKKWSNENQKVKNLIKIYKVNPELVYMTIAIYNAKTLKDVIVKFPSDSFSKSKYPYIFRLAEDDAQNKDKFYNALCGYIKPENEITDLWT